MHRTIVRPAPTMIRGLDPLLWRRFRTYVTARGTHAGPLLNKLLSAWLDRGGRLPEERCARCGHPSGVCEREVSVA